VTQPECFKKNYRIALALPEAAKPTGKHAAALADVPVEAALLRAHDLRRFEIENYWRRATYFWAFQVTSFGFFGLIWKDVGSAGTLDRLSLLIPSGLGAISAQVGWLTARGSKFWQENWEAHVDLLEDEVEGRLTQVVLSRSGRQYSVSAANQNFMLILMVGWIAVFMLVLMPSVEVFVRPYAPWAAFALLFSAMGYLFGWSRTDLRGRRFIEGAWEPYHPRSLKRWVLKVVARRTLEPEIILRDPIGGRLADSGPSND
jgi:hypothetical protein